MLYVDQGAESSSDSDRLLWPSLEGERLKKSEGAVKGRREEGKEEEVVVVVVVGCLGLCGKTERGGA